METIQPSSEAEWLQLRTQDITSTEVSALFGCSPYATGFELWHSKKSQTISDIPTSERMKWGTRLQDAIAVGIAEEQGWIIRRMSEYGRIPELRMGASFDFAIEPDGLLEIKNVDSLQFKDDWLIDGKNIEAPPHIELQVQHQLAVSGKAYAYIGALVGGNTLKLIKREPMPAVIEAIKEKVAAFWKSIEENIEPIPIWPQDAGAVIKMAYYAEPGKIIVAPEETQAMAEEYRRLGGIIKEADAGRETLKAQILLAIGDAERVNGQGYTISAGITGEAEIAYTRKAFRNFKITWKKGGDK